MKKFFLGQFPIHENKKKLTNKEKKNAKIQMSELPRRNAKELLGRKGRRAKW